MGAWLGVGVRVWIRVRGRGKGERQRVVSMQGAPSSAASETVMVFLVFLAA